MINPVPKYAPVPLWVAMSGISRSETYKLLKEGTLHARKYGKRTLVDVEQGLAWMAKLPSALGAPMKRRTAA